MMDKAGEVLCLIEEEEVMLTEVYMPWLGSSGRVSKKDANKFLLAASISHMVGYNDDWDGAEILAETVLDDPDDLWDAITDMGLQELKGALRGKHTKSGCRRCASNDEIIRTGNSNIPRHTALHRQKRWACNTIWKISQNVIEQYSGDARKIWRGESSKVVQNRLVGIGFETDTARMAVETLIDAEVIEGKKKLMDHYMCRVIGRIFEGKILTVKEARHIADTIRQERKYDIEWPLFGLAQQNCYPDKPKCSRCCLNTVCEYHQRHRRLKKHMWYNMVQAINHAKT